MDSPAPSVGAPVRLMLTDPASLVGSIHHGTVTDIGPTWVRVRVGNGSFPVTPELLAEHDRRCAAAELRDVQDRARAGRGGR